MVKRRSATVSAPKARQIAIEKLVPFERNPRSHPEQQVKQIADSIQEFGFLVPILVDQKFNVIAGHGRLMAANLLGLKTVPVLVASHLSKAQKSAYVIADNRIALNSEWDQALLKELAVDLDAEGVDLETLGFTMPEIEEITIGKKKKEDAAQKLGGGKETERVECPKCSHLFNLE